MRRAIIIHSRFQPSKGGEARPESHVNWALGVNARRLPTRDGMKASRVSSIPTILSDAKESAEQCDAVRQRLVGSGSNKLTDAVLDSPS